VKKLYLIITLVFILGIVLTGAFILFGGEEERELAAELNIYNWEDYLGENTVEEFEEEFGVKINLLIYEDEEVLFEDLPNNPGKYDLVIASDAVAKDLVKLGLLRTLNKDNIPNLENVEEFCFIKSDSLSDYVVPYLWGTTGFAIDTNYVQEDIDSWGIFWDEKYAGKMVMLNNPREVVALGAKFVGVPIVPQTLAEFEKVRNALLEQKEISGGYEDPETIEDGLAGGELWVAHIYSGSTGIAAEENIFLKHVIPKEGGVKWIDSWVIPTSAPNAYTAEVFINYILRPEISADIVNYQWTPGCNKAARGLIDEELLKDESLYPSKQDLNNLEFISDYDETDEIQKLRGELWEELIK
jgi:spermidine/putrescine transport system substrate-binding protein